MLFVRAIIVGTHEDGRIEVAREVDGRREIVPVSALRRPRRPDENNGLGEQAKVIALFGEWLPGVVGEVSDEDCADPSRRVSATIAIPARSRGGRGGRSATTTLSRRSLVTMDSGEPKGLSKLRRGSPLVVWEKNEWVNALLIKWPVDPSEGKVQLMAATGTELSPEGENARARMGEITW